MRGTNIQKSIIKPLSTFSGTAVLTMVSATSGPYLTRSEGQRFADITIDGDVLPGTTTGILATGDVHGVVMHNVSIDAVTDRGVQTVADGSGTPFSWYLDNVQVSTATLDGFRLGGATDTTLVDCRAIGCGRHGYYVSAMANSSSPTAAANSPASRDGTSPTAGATAQVRRSRMERMHHRPQRTQRLPHHRNRLATLQFNGIVCRRDGRNANAAAADSPDCAASPPPGPGGRPRRLPGVDDDGSGTNSPQIVHLHRLHLGQPGPDISTPTPRSPTAHQHLPPAAGVGLATGTTAAPTRSTTEPANAAGLSR
jgi:hypothetical protein